MLYLTNHVNDQKVQTQDVSLSTTNSIGVSELYLSPLLKNDHKGILITSIKGGCRTENRIPLMFEHSGHFDFLQLSYKGPCFYDYFPPNAHFKLKEILLKKSNTYKIQFSFKNTYENVLGTGWDIIHIMTKNECDCNYLCEQAIKDDYTVILVMLLDVIDGNNSSQQLTLYPYHVYGTPLHRAVAERDTKIIKTLLKCNLDVNLRNKLGWTPLHIAIDSEMFEVVDLLINNGADVNAKNYDYQTPLHFAAKKNNLKILDCLLKSQAEIDVTDKFGQTPLFYAVDAENVDIVDVILKKNANYKLEDKFYRTPFHLAAQKTNLDIINIFLKNNIDANIVNSRKQTPLLYLNKKSFYFQSKSIYKETYSKIINLLIKNGANVNCQDYYGHTPLYYAVINDNSEFVKALLECNSDINILNGLGRNILHLACLCGANKCIQTLLDSNIDINDIGVKQKTALHIAVEAKCLPLTELLLKNGADPNLKDEFNKTALFLAIKSQYLPIIELLLKNKADVNLKDEFARTALHIASKKSCIRINIIESIINSTNDINAKDILGRTAVHYAVLNCNNCTLEALLKANADVNVKDLTGKTPLHMTVDPKNKYLPNFECINFLIDHKADINPIDNDLISPLHLACFTKNSKIIEYLIENGADSNMKDKDGKTVFHYACMHELNGILLSVDYIKKRLKDTLNVLIKEDVSVNCVDKFGKTPLHYVMQNKYLFMNELLLNIGADINIMDKNYNLIFNQLTLPLDYKKHVIEMKVMNLWVRKKILDKIYKERTKDYMDWIQSYERDCKKEINLMKTTNLDESNLTYYDFLKKNHHDVVNYTRNQCVVIFIESKELIRIFPIYGNFLKCHLRQVQRRSNLYDEIQELSESYTFEKLPTDCMNEIFKYLDNFDLNVLLKAMKPVNS